MNLSQVENIVKEVMTMRNEISLMYTISKDLKSFFDNEKFSDITIILKNSQLHAHKVILSARCPVFFAMLQHEMLENRTSQIKITDIRDEVFRELLRFIYTATVENIGNVSNELLLAADKYGLDDLKRLCGSSLSENLTIDTAIVMLMLADRLNVDNLKLSAIKFINEHASKIITTEDYKLLVKSHLHLVEELYRHQHNATMIVNGMVIPKI